LSVPIARSAGQRVALVVGVLLLTGWALVVRLDGLDGPDGSLTIDEARVALAAEGVLATGLPTLPSGRVYTRGLVTTYLVAPSFALGGRHDRSARMPSVIAGVLLVPTMFLIGRALVGDVGGLAAAAFVAVAGQLVHWSRQAWPPSLFVLLFMLAVYAAYRGFVRGEARWQLVTAALFAVASLTYELALLFLGGLLVYLVLRCCRGDTRWYDRRATPLAAVLAAAALAVAVGLGLALRLGTIAGPTSEFRHFLDPGMRLRPLEFYVENLWGPYLPLLVPIIVALPLCLRAALVARRGVPPTAGCGAPPRGAGLVLSLLVVSVVVPAFVMQNKWEERYVLVTLPLLVLAAAQATAMLARLGSASPPGRPGFRRAIPILALWFGVLVLADDLAGALRAAPAEKRPTWLEELRARGWTEHDPVLVDAPTVASFYLGRSDFYLHDDAYERYARRDGAVIRSIYTNAVLIRSRRDLERRVVAAHRGRSVWIIGRDSRLVPMVRELDDGLWRRLRNQTGVQHPTHDGWWLMRLDPR
jgi:4-amino-4-deoxy-L-arabinose transferase-like glycosyltransferase